MKKARYLLIFILFCLAFLFTGEMYIGYLNNFGTQFYETTMYIQPGISKEEMTCDIEREAAAHGVDVFVIERVFHSNLEEELIFYGTKGTKEYIKEQYLVNDRLYQSVLFGNIKVRFRPIAELDVTKHNKYSIHGTWRQAEDFKISLIDKYAGNHVKNEDGYSIDENDCLILVWSIVIGIIWFVTAYYVILWRREMIVRVTLGERMCSMIFKKMGCDILAQSSIFFLLQYVLSFFNNTYYCMYITMAAFAVMQIGNILIYLTLFSCNYRKVLSQRTNGRGLLKTGYLFQVVSIAIVLLIAGVEMVLIHSGIEYQRQQDFFHTYKDYYYVNISDQWGTNATEDVYTKASKCFYDRYEKIVLEDVSGEFMDDGKYIFANKGAVPYLSTVMPEVANYSWEDKIYFLIPEEMKDDEEVKSVSESIAMTYMDYYEEHETIHYQKAKVIAFGNTTESRSYHLDNPVIILDMTGKKGKEENFNAFCTENALFKITKAEFEKFVDEYQLDKECSRITNIWTYYEHQKKGIMKTAGVAAFLLVILLFLEGVVICQVIQMEYEVNAMQKAVMKILGYSFWKRNLKQYLVILGTTVAAMISVVIVDLIYRLSMMRELLLTCLILGMVSMVIQIIFTYRIEHQKIHKILKGGSL